MFLRTCSFKRTFTHHEAQPYEGDNDDKEQDDRHRGNGDAEGGAHIVRCECEDYGCFLRRCLEGITAF